MAEVWLATDLALTRQVAVKLLKPTLAADPVVAERFRREAIAVAQLSHPNIVAVYDAIEDTAGGSRRLAVVMQLVNGKSLRQLLDEQRRLSPDLTIHIGSCMAAALDAAHRAGLVHRDVKPGNILITPDGRVLLTDFGIAKGLGATGDDLTSANVMMGTAKYLSPEQVRGKKLDGRADLYSLGLVLYECLAGRVPFLGETDTDTASGAPQSRPHRSGAPATDVAVRPRRADPSTARPSPDGSLRDGCGTARRADARSPTAPSIPPTRPTPSRERLHAARHRREHPADSGPDTERRRGLSTGVSAADDPSARRIAPTAHRQVPAGHGNARIERSSIAERPSMILVGGLLAAAMVLAGVLWATLDDDTSGQRLLCTVFGRTRHHRPLRQPHPCRRSSMSPPTTPKATTARRTTTSSR